MNRQVLLGATHIYFVDLTIYYDNVMMVGTAGFLLKSQFFKLLSS